MSSGPPPLNAPPYGERALWAMVVSFAVAVAGVVLLSIYGKENTLALVTALLGVLSVMTTGFFSLMRGQQANHLQLNSRLTDYVAAERAAARAEATLEAQAQQQSAAASAARIAADVATAVSAGKPGEAAPTSEGG